MKPSKTSNFLSCLVLFAIFTSALLGGSTAADAAGWLVNSGDHTVSSTDITTGGANSTGIGVSGSGSSITITGLAKVQTTGEHSDGLRAENNGRLTAGSVDVTTSGRTSEGVYANTSTVSVGGNIRAATSGDASHALWVNGSGKINVSGDVTASTSGGQYDGFMSNGIAAGGSGIMNVDGTVTVKTSGADRIYAVMVDGNSMVNVGKNLDVVTTGRHGHGVYVLSKGRLSVKKDIDVMTQGETAFGISVNEGKIDAAGNITVTTEGATSYGVDCINGGVINAGGKITAKTSGDDAYGVAANMAGSAINASGDINIVTGGARGYGFYIKENGRVTGGGNVTAKTGGESAHAVWANNGTLDVSGNVDVSASGKYAGGIYVTGIDGMLNVGGNLLSATSGNGASSLWCSMGKLNLHGDTAVNSANGDRAAAVFAENKGAVTANGNVSVKMSGDDTYGLLAMTEGSINAEGNVNAAISGKNSLAVVASGGAVNISKDVAASADGDGAVCVYASRNGSVNIDGGLRAEINGSGAEGVSAASGGTVNLNRGAAIRVWDNPVSCAVAARGAGSSININRAGGGLVKIDGDIFAMEDAKVNINMDAAGSYITGSSGLNGAGGSIAGKLDINVGASSAVWNVTGNSFVTGLRNAGTVNFAHDPGKPSASYIKVSAKDYVGAGGNLVMRADIDGQTGDRLEAEKISGETTITAIPVRAGTAERSGALVTAVSNNGARFTLTGERVAAGAWYYELGDAPTASGREWYLRRSTSTERLTSTGYGIASASYHPNLWDTEVNTLFRRMGIYRDDMYNGGLWFTGVVNKNSYDFADSGSYTDNRTYKTGTIGYDRKVETGDEHTKLWIGAMFGYGKDNRDMDFGIGESRMDSYHASLYGIYRADNGSYAVGIAKYNRYKNDYEITRPDPFTKQILGFDTVTGDFKQKGWGLSLQVGRKFEIKPAKEGAAAAGWYWEPQIQASWNRVDGADYKTNSGIDVQVSGSDYFRLRGGVELGRTWELANGTMLNLYGDASYSHEYGGDTDFIMDGGRFSTKHSFGGGYGIFGIGANWRYAPGKYINARFQHSAGSKYTEPFAVYLGLSFEI